MASLRSMLLFCVTLSVSALDELSDRINTLSSLLFFCIMFLHVLLLCIFCNSGICKCSISGKLGEKIWSFFITHHDFEKWKLALVFYHIFSKNYCKAVIIGI